MRLSITDGPELGAWASIVTPLFWSSCSSSLLLANDGTWVVKLVEGETAVSLLG